MARYSCLGFHKTFFSFVNFFLYLLFLFFMDLVLLSPVKKLGNTGDIVNVSRGHAINCLIPQGKAAYATVEEVKRAKALQATRKLSKEGSETWAVDAVARLKGKTILFSEKITAAGKLFGSVAEKDIIAKIMEDLNVELKKDHIRMPHHIKDLGDHSVEIHLSEKQVVKVTVRVEGKDE